MLLNLILLISVILAILILLKEIRRCYDIDQHHILPVCKFNISKLTFEINEHIRIARYKVISKNKNRYFRDFPIAFRFYSKQENFRSKIRITYNVSEYKDDVELVYNRVVEFTLGDNHKEHIYYINDIVVGSLDIEIYTSSQYGKPIILFEILQNNKCHLDKEHKLEIVFPK